MNLWILAIERRSHVLNDFASFFFFSRADGSISRRGLRRQCHRWMRSKQHFWRSAIAKARSLSMLYVGVDVVCFVVRWLGLGLSASRLCVIAFGFIVGVRWRSAVINVPIHIKLFVSNLSIDLSIRAVGWWRSCFGRRNGSWFGRLWVVFFIGGFRSVIKVPVYVPVDAMPERVERRRGLWCARRRVDVGAESWQIVQIVCPTRERARVDH